MNYNINKFVLHIFIGNSVEPIADFDKQPSASVEETSQGKKDAILHYPEIDDQARDDIFTEKKIMASKRVAEDAYQPHASVIRSKKARREGDFEKQPVNSCSRKSLNILLLLNFIVSFLPELFRWGLEWKVSVLGVCKEMCLSRM